jgi:hypothetical protein
MPSVKVAAIIDKTPLLSSYYSNSLSANFDSVLERQKSKLVPLVDLINDHMVSKASYINFDKALSTATQAANKDMNSGHKFDDSPPEEIHYGEDSFMDILGGLSTIGVNLNSVRIGSFEDEYRIAFSLNGEEKMLLYKQEVLPGIRRHEQIRRSSKLSIWLRTCFNEFPAGPTAVIAKADRNDSAPAIIAETKPDVVIADGSSFQTIRGQQLNMDYRYNYRRIQVSEDNDFPWGYSMFSSGQIGTRAA